MHKKYKLRIYENFSRYDTINDSTIRENSDVYMIFKIVLSTIPNFLNISKCSNLSKRKR